MRSYSQNSVTFQQNDRFDEEIDVKTKIKMFLDSIDQYKDSVSTYDNEALWNDYYESLRSSVEDIYLSIDDNYIDAINSFRELEVSNFVSFKDYVINTNTTAKKILRGNLARIKSTRSPRGDVIKCRCGGNYQLAGTEYICNKCGNRRSYDKKMPGSSHKQNMDKHISKQLDIISGVKNLPNNVQVLKPYLIKWLTEKCWLKEWLSYGNAVDTFCKLMHIKEEWFDEPVIRDPEHKYPYTQYASIVNEFFSMFELCNSINMISDSNMYSLPEEQRVEICRDYFNEFNKIPDRLAVFEGYQIGSYITKLHNIYDKSPLEQEICKIFNSNLKVGGLMFNFAEIRKQISAPPKKFNLSSIYTDMSHLCFNVQYIPIVPNDKIAIESIIKEFNKYYKNKQEEEKCGKFNSPLFFCTLYCIIKKLKYFRKYEALLSIIPDKYILSKAMSLICSVFILFMNDCKDFVGKYRQENIDDSVREKAFEIIKSGSIPNLPSREFSLEPIEEEEKEETTSDSFEEDF